MTHQKLNILNRRLGYVKAGYFFNNRTLFLFVAGAIVGRILLCGANDSFNGFRQLGVNYGCSVENCTNGLVLSWSKKMK